jgi:hypothetical protein
LVRLLDTPFDRCPAGGAYLTRLLLRGRWQICRRHRGKGRQGAETGVSDDAHVRFLPDEGFSFQRGVTPAIPKGQLQVRP